eukprot:793621-Amphidinium_carterae.1
MTVNPLGAFTIVLGTRTNELPADTRFGQDFAALLGVIHTTVCKSAFGVHDCYHNPIASTCHKQDLNMHRCQARQPKLLAKTILTSIFFFTAEHILKLRRICKTRATAWEHGLLYKTLKNKAKAGSTN